MKKIGIALLMGVMLSIWACDDQEAPLECPTDLACTEVFVTLVYEPKDQNNDPIMLDNYYSHNLDHGIIYNFADVNTPRTDGVYEIITDAQKDDLQAKGTLIRFFGERDGEVVLQQDFLIGHDCCHVIVLEGPGSEN